MNNVVEGRAYGEGEGRMPIALRCPTCEQWRREYNVAVANGRLEKTRQVARRIDAHGRLHS